MFTLSYKNQTLLHYYIYIIHYHIITYTLYIIHYSAYLINGFLVSDCLLPCLRTEATVKEGTASGGEELPTFYLLFNPEVRVTVTTVDKFKFLEALNFFGSNLGLWPGLGLYQMVSIIYLYFYIFIYLYIFIYIYI